MSLQDFLNANPIENLIEKVTVSNRFKDAKGNAIPFEIKAMTSPEFDEIRKGCTTIKKGRKVEFDAQKFNMKIAINHTVTPDFKHAESIQKLGCKTPEEYLNKVLLSGELATLAEKIQLLSGFNVEMEELIEEAKN